MSKPVFEDIFKFSGRRNRQSYIFLGLAQIVAVIGLVIVASGGAAMVDSFAPLAYLLFLAAFAGFVAVAVSGWASASQRVRDFGQSGVWVLVTLVPYVGWIFSLAIMVIPSTPGENKYGPSCIEQ